LIVYEACSTCWIAYLLPVPVIDVPEDWMSTSMPLPAGLTGVIQVPLSDPEGAVPVMHAANTSASTGLRRATDLMGRLQRAAKGVGYWKIRNRRADVTAVTPKRPARHEPVDAGRIDPPPPRAR
jgi:hypothetical protein